MHSRAINPPLLSWRCDDVMSLWLCDDDDDDTNYPLFLGMMMMSVFIIPIIYRNGKEKVEGIYEDICRTGYRSARMSSSVKGPSRERWLATLTQSQRQ